MDLQLKQISYHNFRNYEDYQLDTDHQLVLIVGPNAIGKTNLIEGVHLTTGIASFRPGKTEHLIRRGSESAYISSDISDGNRKLEVKLSIQQGKRTYYYNGKKTTSDRLRGLLPSVTFVPDDLKLIKGSYSDKRRQLDALGQQVSSNYHAVLSDYEKILSQKNRYLKEDISSSYLSAINEVAASIGSQLYVMRQSLFSQLSPYIIRCYQEITHSSEEILLTYTPSWAERDRYSENVEITPVLTKSEAKELLLSKMEQEFSEEQRRGRSIFGPHNDHLDFYIQGENAHYFASQGQQRSLVLAWKMAEVLLIQELKEQYPVLLLDDVMSELDAQRREQFLYLISEKTQTFITSTTTSYFPDWTLRTAHLIELRRENGNDDE